MRRREYLRGADLEHRGAIDRFLGQSVDRAGETVLPDHQRTGGVAMVIGVGDHRTRLFDARQGGGILAEFTEHHVEFTVT